MLSVNQRWGIVFVLLLLGSLVGCAGKPPMEKLSLARAGVTAAREAGAAQAGAEEFKLAQEYLVRAEQALEQKQYDAARDWADRATLAAEAARAKGQEHAAGQRLGDTRRNLDQLQQDLDRLRSRTDELKRQL
jgi:chromosome segregation ATPase